MELKLIFLNATPLIYAVKNGHLEIVRLFLLQKCIDINFKVIRIANILNSISNLCFCIKLKSLKIFMEFHIDHLNWTVLSCASHYGRTEIARVLLLQKGIDVNIQDIQIHNHS